MPKEEPKATEDYAALFNPGFTLPIEGVVDAVIKELEDAMHASGRA